MPVYALIKVNNLEPELGEMLGWTSLFSLPMRRRIHHRAWSWTSVGKTNGSVCGMIHRRVSLGSDFSPVRPRSLLLNRAAKLSIPRNQKSVVSSTYYYRSRSILAFQLLILHLLNVIPILSKHVASTLHQCFVSSHASRALWLIDSVHVHAQSVFREHDVISWSRPFYDEHNHGRCDERANIRKNK